jgi:hypothetical protein
MYDSMRVDEPVELWESTPHLEMKERVKDGKERLDGGI